MGDEIQTYILQKLDNAINEASSSHFHLAAKLFLRPPLSQQFKELKDLLQTKLDASSAASNSAVHTDAAAQQANFPREQLYYIDNVLTQWQMIMKNPTSTSCGSINSLTNLGHNLRKIKQDLSLKKAKPESRRGEGGGSSTTTPTALEPVYRWSSPHVDEKRVFGIEDKVSGMQRVLVLRRGENDLFKAFGLYGMAGIGKTTVCQCFFSRTNVKNYFLPRIWVCLSKQKEDESDHHVEVVKRMLMCLGVGRKVIDTTHERQGIKGLLLVLRFQLKGKRYLIVLDDAWSDDEWFKMTGFGNEEEDTFAFGFPKACGGTVIVSSRSKQVVQNMVGKEHNVRCLMPYTDTNTCWKIFLDSVEKDGVKFPGEELEALEEEIVKMCAGLPLSAKMLGEIKHQQIIKSTILEPS